MQRFRFALLMGLWASLGAVGQSCPPGTIRTATSYGSYCQGTSSTPKPGTIAVSGSTELKIDEVMTASELQETGVAALTQQQRSALNRWLTRYTTTVITVARPSSSNERSSMSPATKTSCVPAIESTISGEFEGWDGETIFKLDNGQIWQQAEYDYMYSYQYRPDVTIYQTSGGCLMKVEDENETILVRQVR